MSRPPDARKGGRPWFTIAEASLLLGVSERAVQLRARKGALSSRKERSPETGRMRLMVSGPELAAASPPSLAAAVRSLVRQDFIPRFSPDLETEPTLQVEEWAELAAGAEALGESGNGGERRTLEQQKRDLELALDREREAAARQERSLQRYIDRLERRQRERETRLRGQLDDLARTLGRTEYLLLLTRRSWWRRALAWLLGRRLPTFRHASRTHLRTPREARERRAPSGESGPGARRRRTRTGLTKNRGQ